MLSLSSPSSLELTRFVIVLGSVVREYARRDNTRNTPRKRQTGLLCIQWKWRIVGLHPKESVFNKCLYCKSFSDKSNVIFYF